MLYTFIDKKQNGKSGDSTKATPPLLDSGESGAPWVWLHGRRGGKNTQEKLYKKGLNELDNHDAVVTHLQPDNMECEVKRA